MSEISFCWNIPPGYSPDKQPTYIIRDSHGLHCLGEDGPRPVTNEEILRWMRFRADITKYELGEGGL